jgi:hypothetical protein
LRREQGCGPNLEVQVRYDAWAAHRAGERLQPFVYEPAPLAADEVEVAITHCGIRHSEETHEVGWSGSDRSRQGVR